MKAFDELDRIVRQMEKRSSARRQRP